MALNETIVVFESKLSTPEVLQMGTCNGISFAIGLVILAFAAIFIKCLFIYYIRYHAQKDRPINDLIKYDQVR